MYAAPLPLSRPWEGPKQLYEIIVESVLSPGGLVKKAGRISMEQAKMQKRIF